MATFYVYTQNFLGDVAVKIASCTGLVPDTIADSTKGEISIGFLLPISAMDKATLDAFMETRGLAYARTETVASSDPAAILVNKSLIGVPPIVTSAPALAGFGQLLRADAGLGAFDVLLPDALSGSGETLYAKNVGASGVVTLVPAYGQTIDGALLLPLVPGQKIQLASVGTHWVEIG